MSNDLNATFAISKQTLTELLELATLDALTRFEFGAEPKRARIASLLGKLNTYINTVKRALNAVVGESASPPILILPAAHREFWNDTLAPNARILQRAYFEISGLGVFFDLLDEPPLEEESRMFSAISWGLERWSNMLDEDEQFEWLTRGFNIEGARDLVAMPWFQPDDWAQNLRLLDPVLVDRPASVMRDHIRYRLAEIYRAFTFGLWMSSIALCRSLVDFGLRQNAPRCQVSITREGPSGKPEDKSLRQLGEEIAVFLPAIAEPVEVVRDTGNRILHPKKHDVISHPRVMRAEALECIRAARKVIERLYSEQGPAR